MIHNSEEALTSQDSVDQVAAFPAAVLAVRDGIAALAAEDEAGVFATVNHTDLVAARTMVQVLYGCLRQVLYEVAGTNPAARRAMLEAVAEHLNPEAAVAATEALVAQAAQGEGRN